MGAEEHRFPCETCGSDLRFEPGESREVELVEMRGDRVVFGMNGLVNGPLEEKAR